MLLSEIFKDAPAVTIKNLMSDSRKKTQLGLFFCLKGMTFDGHRFVNQAIDNGAVAIVYSDPLAEKKEGVTYIQVKDVLKTLNQVANTFYHKPSTQVAMYGVTGTNGKSTIATLIHYFNSQFEKSGYIGTIAIEIGNQKHPAQLTTPEIIDLQRILDDMVKADVKSVSLEVSSIGLEQHRVDGIAFDVGIFTNLTHDHLDYHGTMENYFTSKAKLFELIPDDGLAIINLDDPYAQRMMAYPSARICTYGIESEADFVIDDIELSARGTTFKLIDTKKDITTIINTNLVAQFNVMNLTAALIAISEYRQIPISDLVQYCKRIPQIDGRMEVIEGNHDFTSIVDYAHTPDSFIQCFEYAKSITPKENRIISVFGSAGKRDSKKRSILGEIADLYCDLIILTEDDPRDEDVLEICNQIKVGIKKANYIIIEDRINAIHQALSLANSNDTVLILGKGDDMFMARALERAYYPGDHVIAKEILHEIEKQKQEEDDESIY